MKYKNKVKKNRSIEKKHPEPKKPINPICPPKQNLDGSNRFGGFAPRKMK